MFQEQQGILSFFELIELTSNIYSHSFLQSLGILTMASINFFLIILIPIILTVIISAIASNIIQIGFLFSTTPITPSPDKIGVISGVKRIFNIKNLVEFLKSIIKITFLSFLIYFSMKNYFQDMINLTECGKYCILPLLGKIFFKLMLYTFFAFFLVAIFDYIFQRKQYTKELRMSFKDIKDEHKETDGNPEIKSKRKQAHQEIMSDTSKKHNVQRSSVIITNPTHIAIGIFYQKEKTPLPLITIKGVNHIAQDIKSIASDAGVPILENRMLARALLAQGKTNQYIPSSQIEAVAEVLLWVKRLKQEQEKPV